MDKARSVHPATLHKSLGLSEAIALGVGGTIGGGVFVLIGIAAGQAGPGVILSFILAFTASVLVALCYAELAARLPKAGGGYAFAREALGNHAGFLMGWGYWGSYLAASGYVTLGFGAYLHALTGISQSIGAIGLILLMVIPNLLGAQISGRIQRFIVILEVGTLLLLVAIGIPHTQGYLYYPLFPQGVFGVFTAAVSAFLAFGGFDMIAAAGEEIKDPVRNIPRAIFGSLIIVLILYVSVLAVAVGIVPWYRLGTLDAPLAVVSQRILGDFGPTFVNSAALIATAATTNAVLMVMSRIAFAMARDRLLPRVFATIHPQWNTPVVAIGLSASLMIGLAATGSVTLAASAAGFLYILHFIYDLIALFVFRFRDSKNLNNDEIRFRVPGYPVVPIITLIIITALIFTITQDGLIIGAIWLVTGVIYRIILVIYQNQNPNRSKA